MSDKPNIPVKTTGSTLSADELNTIVDAFALKPDADEIAGLTPDTLVDGSIFQGDGKTPETAITILDEGIAEIKLSESVQIKLNNPADVTTSQLNTEIATRVATTGDESISGVKTFTSSPIVPEPTTDLQTATKKYVDDLIAVLSSESGSVVNVSATGDAKIVNDAVITSTNLTVTSATANFTSSDVGKTIGIPYAGDGTTVGETHVTTITSVNSASSITINSAPIKSIVGPRIITDAAINKNSKTLNSATANFTIGDIGKRIEIPDAGLLKSNNEGSELPCYITSVVSTTSVNVSRKSLATVSGKTVTIPGATIVYGTDNTTALQNAFNEGSSNKKTVLIGSGKHLITQQLIIDDNLKVIGQSNGISGIYPVGTGGMAAIRGEDRDSSNPYQDCQFMDFEINCIGVRTKTYQTGNKAIYITYMDRPVFKNLHIRNSSATGLGCDFLRDYVIENNIVDHCGAQVQEFGGGGGGSGIGIGTGRWTVEAGIITGNQVNDCGNQGIFYESQSSNILSKGGRIIGNFCSWNNNAGIGDRATEGTIITGNTCVYNGGSGIELNEGFVSGLFSKNGIISSNTLGNNNNGLNVRFKEGFVKITDNTITDSTKAIEVNIPSGGSGADLEISGSTIINSTFESIHLATGTLRSLRITRNHIMDGGANRAAILCKLNVGRLYLKNNECYDNRASKSQTYGFEATSTSTIDRFVHGGNDFVGNSIGEMEISQATITETVLQ